MAQELVIKVIKDKLNERVKINKLLGRKRGIDLMEGKVIEINKKELEILMINNWVKEIGDK